VIVVSDTSPITNLAAIGQLDLLRQLYDSVIIPLAVYNEMVSVDRVVPGTLEVQTFDWIQTQTVADSNRVVEIQENIHLGEAEAIVLALELEADLLLMDERRGRAVAMSYGVNVTGLLGVLLQAKRNGLLSAVKPVIHQLMEQVDFRISSQLYVEILQTAGEL
jgi:predicted nucleic acid-binding protein